MKSEALDLDRLLVQEIGQFGWFQARMLLLALVVPILGAWNSMEFLFTAARIPTRCFIPGCDAAQPDFSPAWISSVVPISASGVPDSCFRYANTSTISTQPGTCPANLFDSSTLLPCEEFVYANTNTVVYDFNLACDEWRRSIIGSVQTLGTLINLPFSGYMSDRWGRRTMLVIATLNTAWVGLSRYWASSYIAFVLLQTLESVIGSGIYISSFILLTEITGPKYRLAVAAAMNSAFTVGQIFLGLIAWSIPNWQQLTLALYFPHLIIITYIWLMNESVRWYMSKNRFAEADGLLRRMAKANGNQISPESLLALRQTTEDEKKRRMEQIKTAEPWLVVKVFKHKRVLLRCVIGPVWWVTSTFIYYGMTINAVNMAGNSYVNFIVVAAVEIPGYWAAAFLNTRLGRKPVLISAFWICAACQLGYILIPSEMYAVSLTVYLVGKLSIAMEVTSLYIYTAELFPTQHRQQLFGFCSMIGRVGAIVAPLTPAIGASTFENFPSVLFGSFALLSGLLVLLTPETRGVNLADSMEEAEQLGRK